MASEAKYALDAATHAQVFQQEILPEYAKVTRQAHPRAIVLAGVIQRRQNFQREDLSSRDGNDDTPKGPLNDIVNDLLARQKAQAV